MSGSRVNVVLVHGAWADGSSWGKVIADLRSNGVNAVTVPVPLTTLADDVAALERTLERVDGPVVLAAHAYAGAVIASARNPKVKALVYVAALAPAEGETVADVFYHNEAHPKAPKLGPDNHGLIWLPEDAFAAAFAQNASPEEQAVLADLDRVDEAQAMLATALKTWPDNDYLKDRAAPAHAPTRIGRPGAFLASHGRSGGKRDQGAL